MNSSTTVGLQRSGLPSPKRRLDLLAQADLPAREQAWR